MALEQLAGRLEQLITSQAGTSASLICCPCPLPQFTRQSGFLPSISSEAGRQAALWLVSWGRKPGERLK